MEIIENWHPYLEHKINSKLLSIRMDANRIIIIVFFFLEWMSLYMVSQYFYDAIIMGLERILLRLSI